MISVSEAREIIRTNVSALEPIEMPLHDAAGLTLAEDVYATVDIPAFPQSAMDGYALAFSALQENKELIIEGEVPAGSAPSFEINQQHAVRIFTGAAVPSGADTVVIQERTRTENGKLIIEDEKLRLGSNVRPMGSEIKGGSLALAKGNGLSPAAVGFLAGIGTNLVKAYPNPSITIIVTGNELQEPGTQLQYGQVYESNSFSLGAALDMMNIKNVTVQHVHDDEDTLTNVLQQALKGSDVVLLTGGVSVGDYDFVTKATMTCGVTRLFHKVKQRPGKPLFFGKKENKLVFGLPGNPSSVLTCFYMYVLPALEQLSIRSFGQDTIEAKMGKSFSKDASLTHFLKGHYDGNTATPLDAQESYRMRSFAAANCLIEISEEITQCAEGSVVRVHLLYR